jgi:hypothetical protein
MKGGLFPHCLPAAPMPRPAPLRSGPAVLRYPRRDAGRRPASCVLPGKRHHNNGGENHHTAIKS